MTSIDIFDDLLDDAYGRPRFRTTPPRLAVVPLPTPRASLAKIAVSVGERIGARLALPLNGITLAIVAGRIRSTTTQRDAAVVARDRELAHALDLERAEWQDLEDALIARRATLRERAGWES